MTNRSKQKGTAFEALIAAGLAAALEDDRIERRTLSGTNDRGDIAGVRIGPHRLVIECKAVAGGKTLHLPEWTAEARTECRNDGALAGLVVSKRTGTTDPMKQWFHGEVQTLVDIIRAFR